MIIGIICRGLNYLYFNQNFDFFIEFVPQIIFMTILFGYMAIMIFIKWSVNWPEIGVDKAPSIITLFMSMFGLGANVNN